ncbi:DUF2550 domain-containing protein [Micromonospora taraxaci]|uniref:DUF2550 domain-containing protein n=2 Tax=Micromonospora TaxID=1873 RepID=A0A1C4WAZ2_9ACTN|nr:MULTISPECIES: DUF2550 domain-containing protein [Micromonospora]MCZ7378722.1 DUF2550 domain-containing protein [Micromonospora sp. WMMC250]MDG4783506.1 DUF2550 domain-containing protein [Micromonospora sp. WMMD961]MDG4841287.1 DUF2550 domain-containing protein [Micromonospora sp. WMMD967]TWG16066.1 uncharacterized protein DUF2550 [Micromonospora taraxaci]SCE93353.1 Protein of unknown function [Micromonospora chokoriensis]
MEIVEGFGIGVVVILVALLILFVRRALVTRSGGIIRLSVRVTTVLDGRGWSPGFGRFVGDELRWYRMFSFAIRPKRVLSRKGLAVERRRLPEGQERLSMPADWVILRCTSHHAPVEIAMARSTVTGFLSWLEAAPPGAVSPRMASQDWPAA